MSFAKAFTLLASALLAQCATIPKADEAAKRNPVPIEVPFTVKRGPNATYSENLSFQEAPSFFGRSAASSNQSKPYDIDATLTNYFTWYYVTLEVGSNGDTVELQVDTGSSDTWVIDSRANCSGCAEYGTYSPSTSTSAKQLTNYPDFSIVYGDGTVAEGKFYLDTMTLAGVAIEGAVFADVTDAPRNFGLLGIGFESLEATEYYDNFNYTNFPQQLVDDGLIEKAVYSIYLNSYNATSGSIIFGGYDTEKYYGSLTTLPITSKYYLTVEADSFTLPNGEVLDLALTNAKYGDPLLDSGTSYMTIPHGSDIRTSFLEGLGVTNLTSYEIPCDTSGSFSINFAENFTLDIELQDMIEQDFDGICYLLFQYEDNYTFGDAILRNLYVLFDLEAKTISLGKVKYTSATNIVLST